MEARSSGQMNPILSGWLIMGPALSSREPDGQNGASGRAYYPFCGATEKDPVKAGSAMSAEHDQGRIYFGCSRRDFVVRGACYDSSFVIRKSP